MAVKEKPKPIIDISDPVPRKERLEKMLEKAALLGELFATGHLPNAQYHEIAETLDEIERFGTGG